MPMPMRKENNVQYEWFIGWEDHHSYRAAADGHTDDDFMDGVRCRDGKKRDLVRCTYEQAQHLWASRSDLGIKIKIFNRQGIRGPIRDCTFLFKRRARKKAHA